MKRIIRIVWISALTGLAFLVACTSQNRMSRQERKELKNKRALIEQELSKFQDQEYLQWEEGLLQAEPGDDISVQMKNLQTLSRNNQEEIELRKQLLEIDKALKDNASASQHEQKLSDAINKQKSINKAMKNIVPPCVYGPPPTRPQGQMTPREKKEKIEKLENELDSIVTILQRKEGACVYGSPEVIERYNKETERLREEAERIHKELLRLKNK